MGFMGQGGRWSDFAGLSVPAPSATSFTYVRAGVQKIAGIAGGRAGDFRLDRGQNFEKNTPVNAVIFRQKTPPRLQLKPWIFWGWIQ